MAGVLVAVALGLSVAGCGARGDDVDPTGGFGEVAGAADASGSSGDSIPRPVPEESTSEGPGDPGDDVGAPGDSADGSGGTPDPSPTATSDGGGSTPPGDAQSQALAVWDEFLTSWADLRNGEATRDSVAAVAVLDEAMAELVDGSVEADEARATATVELYGGTRSDIVVSGPMVTFVDCVYEKALGPLPWVLAQRWDVTVGLTAGPAGGPAVTGLTQRATVADDGEVVFDVCLNPVLEDEVIAAHIALQRMYAELGADPAVGIDDARIDQLLGVEAADDFRSALTRRIEEGSRLRNGLGENPRVAVFSHQPNLVGTVGCEDQLEGFARVDADGKVVAAADPSLQTVSTARLEFLADRWVASETTGTNNTECGADPLDAVAVVGGLGEAPSP